MNWQQLDELPAGTFVEGQTHGSCIWLQFSKLQDGDWQEFESGSTWTVHQVAALSHVDVIK